MPVFTNNDVDSKEEIKSKNGEEQIKPGFLDILAFIIAAFQILIPYLIVFILAILMVPAIFYLVTFLTNR